MSQSTLLRVAVVGVGSFGKNHARVVHQSPHAELSGILDPDPVRAAAASEAHACKVFSSLEELAAASDAAIVASPTSTHAEIGKRLMELGLDVLVEKPLADDLTSGRELLDTAQRTGRNLMVGHLERFNPAIIALRSLITTPLFFEIHRLSEFSPRSLDVDVVLDLMIHDIDIILSMMKALPDEIRAAGIHILSEHVDIANVRLQFSNGCVANLTASRVSTERVRKLRLFQPREYISVDYSRQDGARFFVKPDRSIGFAPLPATKDEPLRLEFEEFVSAIRERRAPAVTGAQALAALQVAHGILDKIGEHARLVNQALAPNH